MISFKLGRLENRRSREAGQARLAEAKVAQAIATLKLAAKQEAELKAFEGLVCHLKEKKVKSDDLLKSKADKIDQLQAKVVVVEVKDRCRVSGHRASCDQGGHQEGGIWKSCAPI